MSLAAPTRSPLPPLGCVAAALAAVALSACGADQQATTGSAAAAPMRSGEKPGLSAHPCPRQVGDFHRDLDALRRRLAVGLSYEQYAAQVKTLSAGYAEIPISHLTLQCLSKIGTSSERAFNRYIDGVNAWGECLADASCTTATIEPVLQRRWREASHSLSEVR